MEKIWFVILFFNVCFLIGGAGVAIRLLWIAKTKNKDSCLLSDDDIWNPIEETEKKDDISESYYWDVLLIMILLGEKLKLFSPGEILEDGYNTTIIRMAKNTKKLADPLIKHNPVILADALVNQLFTILTLAAKASIPLDEVWEAYIDHWHICVESQTFPDQQEAYQPYWGKLNEILTKYGWQPPEIN